MTRGVLIAAAVAVVVPVVFAPFAHADDNDTTYINALHKRGISDQKGDGALVNLGHIICGLLADGYSMAAVEDMGDLHEGAGLSDDDVKFLVTTAAASYCPQYIQ